MSFEVPADAYDKFMGKYSIPLAKEFADFIQIQAKQSVLDVGCGPGAFTQELAQRLDKKNIWAIDPSHSFICALRHRLPEVHASESSAESLAFESSSFDVAAAQLVFHFMSNPIQGAREMTRVVKPEGTIAACVWDFDGGRSPISIFWEAVNFFEGPVEDESARMGSKQSDLPQLFESIGLSHIQSTELNVRIFFEAFDTWWTPITLGVGRSGAYAQQLGIERLQRIRARCFEKLGSGPFEISAVAWATKATRR